jgi:hypothetical protein
MQLCSRSRTLFQEQGDEARAVEAILSGQVSLEQQKQPLFAQTPLQHRHQSPPAPSQQNDSLHDLLRDGFTISKSLYAIVINVNIAISPSQPPPCLAYLPHLSV